MEWLAAARPDTGVGDDRLRPEAGVATVSRREQTRGVGVQPLAGRVRGHSIDPGFARARIRIEGAEEGC